MKRLIFTLCCIFSLVSCAKREFYETGELRSIVKKSVFGNEITRIEYYKSGSIKKSETWKDGAKSETHTLFHENGSLHKAIPFEKGKANGIVEVYYSTGELESTTTYIDDARKGEFKAYFRNGNLSMIGEFLEDSFHFWRKEFYENGQLMAYNYVRDSVNYLKFFSPEGNLIDVQLPLKVYHSTSLVCIELTHSSIPSDSLKVAFYFGSEDDILSGSPEKDKAVLANGHKVCVDTETLEANAWTGIFCEMLEGSGIQSFTRLKIPAPTDY